MKILKSPILPLAALVTLTGTLGAQEFFREFGTSRSSGGIGRSSDSIGMLSPAVDVFTGNDPSGLPGISPVDQVQDEENYNMKIGDLEFLFALGVGVEFNDNINLSNRNKISDIAIRPEFDIEGLWRISDTNKLKFGVAIGYAWYMDHSEFSSDSLLISPNSAIVYSTKWGQVTFTIHESFSYQEDTFDQPQLSNVARYRRKENNAGIQMDWEASEYTHITVGYDRFDLWADDEIFKAQDRGLDTVFVRPSYQISPKVLVGLSASMSWINYKEDLQSDGTVLLVGPYVQWRMSDRSSLYLEVGYQQANFDSASQIELVDPRTGALTGRFITDSEDTNNMYFKVEAVHTPSENFRHKLSASRTAEIGMGSNFYDLFHFEYTIDWKATEKISVRPAIFYEFYETSGSFSEEANRLGVALGLYYLFSDHLTFGLDYRFIKKDSNLPSADYVQNLGLLSIFYKF